MASGFSVMDGSDATPPGGGGKDWLGDARVAFAFLTRLPLTATAEGLYNALNARGQAKADHSAVVTILEELAACRVALQKPKDREPS